MIKSAVLNIGKKTYYICIEDDSCGENNTSLVHECSIAMNYRANDLADAIKKGVDALKELGEI